MRTFIERFPAKQSFGGASAKTTLVSCAIVAPILRDLLKREGRTMDADNGTRENGAWEWSGALYLTAERAGHILGQSREAVVRRIYSILNSESEMTSANIVDAIFLTLNEHLCDHAIPEFPGSHAVAREMVDAWVEESDGENEVDDRDELAHLIYRFTIGFAHSEEVCDPEVAAKKEEMRAASAERSRQLRKKRQKQLAVAA